MTSNPVRRITALLFACGLISTLSIGQDEKKESQPEPPKERVTKIGATSYRLGEIEFDAKSREIKIPSVMNMPEGGPIEYLLVHESGKVHEGMLVTKAKPIHLQIVMKLLKFKSGDGQIFDAFAPDEEQRRQLNDPAKRPRGDGVQVVAQWKDGDGKDQEKPVAGWVLDGFDQEAMTDEPWIYTGSHVMDGQFLAEIEGSIIAVYLDQLALFNMTREGANLDTRWGANEDATPPLGTPVTLILKPDQPATKKEE